MFFDPVRTRPALLVQRLFFPEYVQYCNKKGERRSFWARRLTSPGIPWFFSGGGDDALPLLVDTFTAGERLLVSFAALITKGVLICCCDSTVMMVMVIIIQKSIPRIFEEGADSRGLAGGHDGHFAKQNGPPRLPSCTYSSADDDSRPKQTQFARLRDCIASHICGADCSLARWLAGACLGNKLPLACCCTSSQRIMMVTTTTTTTTTGSPRHDPMIQK